MSASPPLWAKILVGILGVIGLVAIWARLAAQIFVLLSKVQAEPGFLTLYQYWRWYGFMPELMKHMHMAMAIAAAPFGFVIWLIFSKRDNRPLFGAARFAKQSEISKAGLLGTEGIIIGKRGKQFLMIYFTYILTLNNS